MLKSRKTGGKSEDIPRRARPPEAPDDVFDELRRLYVQYGAGEVPQRIIDLAKELEAELERGVGSRGERVEVSGPSGERRLRRKERK